MAIKNEFTNDEIIMVITAATCTEQQITAKQLKSKAIKITLSKHVE